MKHLTTDEIIDFVTAREADEGFLSLAQKVNTHIMQCSECLKKVRAFQLVADELENMTDIPGYAQRAYGIKDVHFINSDKNNNQLDK